MSIMGFLGTSRTPNKGETKEMTTIEIDEFKNGTAPFEDYGVGSDGYMSIEDILGKRISIYAVDVFENQNGEGVYILARTPAVRNGDFFYLCTHAVGLVNILKKPEVGESLKGGDTIGATIVKRKSQKSDRMVYAFA